MSLLIEYNDPQVIKASKIIFEEHFKRDPKLNHEYDERRKKLMYDDIVYNLSYLLTAVYFDDEKIFEDYAVWIYELLCHLMKDLDRNRICEQMVDHYSIMSESISSHLKGTLNEDEIEKATRFLKTAIAVTQRELTNIPLSTSFSEGKFAYLRDHYLKAILTNQTRQAHQIIADAVERGDSIVEIYEEVLTKVMHEIGELWHKNIITIDKEHYATSVTQTVMSQYYDQIFSRPRKSRTLMSCAVGSELHEMGIRMLSDIFEYHGWDTYYLGAAMPQSAILNAIEEYQPDLLALSVTMPPYLKTCEQIVKAVREKYPDLKIAIGGQAFKSTEALWSKWEVDFYSPTASDLLGWAENNII